MIFGLCYNSQRGIIAIGTAQEFTHNPPLCEILSLLNFMSNITIQHITPRHFYEAVKLLKQTEHNIRFSYDTVEIRFVFDRLETAEQTQARFEKMEHLGEFFKGTDKFISSY